MQLSGSILLCYIYTALVAQLHWYAIHMQVGGIGIQIVSLFWFYKIIQVRCCQFAHTACWHYEMYVVLSCLATKLYAGVQLLVLGLKTECRHDCRSSQRRFWAQQANLKSWHDVALFQPILKAGSNKLALAGAAKICLLLCTCTWHKLAA